MSNNTNIAIIGGGASGLIAGIMALRNGANVTIYEKNQKAGRKILASGNGRCNITNENIDKSRYHGGNDGFISSVLNRFTLITCREFFQSIGIKLTKNENNRYYPLSLQSLSVVEALEYEFGQLGGNLVLNCPITSIKKNDDIFCLNSKYQAQKVLIATGSVAMSKLGGCGSGYEFARDFNHKVTPLFPSLVQLVAKEDNFDASGVKFVADVKLFVNKSEKISAKGDILLTKYGLSGSALLDVSRYASEGIMDKKSVQITIDCMSEFSKDRVSSMINSLIKKCPTKLSEQLLNGIMNKKLATLILKRCKISAHKRANELNKKEINSIIYTVKNLTFNIIDTKGFDSAEVVAGGVHVEQIDSKTLQSKLIKNLFFSGEVLDVDGDCGGFNLHWAWASGYICGLQMAK